MDLTYIFRMCYGCVARRSCAISSLQSRVVFDSCLPLGPFSSYWVALLTKQDIHLPGLSFSLSGYDINIPHLGLGFEGKQVRKDKWQCSRIHPSFLPAFSSFDVRGRAWSSCSLLCHIWLLFLEGLLLSGARGDLQLWCNLWEKNK